MNPLHFIAQDTQPVAGLPSWAVGILAIIGALAPIFFAWLAYKRAGEAKVTAGEAKVDAASAKGATGAIQESITRVSARQNSTDVTTSHQPPTVGRSPLLLLPLLALFFTGCAALTTSAPESWVRADRATFTAVSGEYLEYVDNDSTLDQPGKDRRHRTIETWNTRLTEHEKTLAPPAN